MLIEQTHADLKFAANIQRLAENTEAIAKSLAVIAGLMAHKEGRPFADPTRHTEHTKFSEQPLPKTQQPTSETLDADIDDDTLTYGY